MQLEEKLGNQTQQVQQLQEELASTLGAEQPLTPHDQELFGQWQEQFPSGSGIRSTLRNFLARRWSADLDGDIERFVDEWVDRRFSDDELQISYERFYVAARDLAAWMGDHGFENAGVVAVPKPDRVDLLDQYYETIRLGQRLADAMADTAAEFEHVAHRRGI